jgi:hypothetical protein
VRLDQAVGRASSRASTGGRVLYAKETKAFGALNFCCEMGKASWCLPGSRDARTTSDYPAALSRRAAGLLLVVHES